jgi:hypothetical protein
MAGLLLLSEHTRKERPKEAWSGLWKSQDHIKIGWEIFTVSDFWQAHKMMTKVQKKWFSVSRLLVNRPTARARMPSSRCLEYKKIFEWILVQIDGSVKNIKDYAIESYISLILRISWQVN